MFELFVPFLIGTALGIQPQSTTSAELAAPVEVTTVTETAAVPSGAIVPSPTLMSAAEVKPILDGTTSKWIAVRKNEDQDVVYFTHLVSWRCGLTSVAYGVNGAAPSQPFEMEPCYAGTSAPNALMVTEGFDPFVTFEADTVETVTVAVAYDDGSTNLLTYTRDQVLLR